MKTDMSPRTLLLLAVAAVALVSLIGWYGFVSPQHSKADKLDGEIASAQVNLASATQLARSVAGTKGKNNALRLLAVAIPADLQMPSVLRQVQRLAVAANVNLDSFKPSPAISLAGYESVPIDVSVSGRYLEIVHFLHRLRVQAGATKGKVHATGRLFSVESVGLTPAISSELTASIRIDAFVFSGVTTPATTTSASTTAAGATP